MSRGRPVKHQEGELCESCLTNEKRFKGYSVAGTKIYGAECPTCHSDNVLTKDKKAECEMCGYQPLFKRTLDIHHRDGDHHNNDPTNRMTLCANCHRELEASIHEIGDWRKAESWLKRFITRILFK